MVFLKPRKSPWRYHQRAAVVEAPTRQAQVVGAVNQLRRALLWLARQAHQRCRVVVESQQPWLAQTPRPGAAVENQ